MKSKNRHSTTRRFCLQRNTMLNSLDLVVCSILDDTHSDGNLYVKKTTSSDVYQSKSSFMGTLQF
jgi:hypothetical protein